MTFEAESRYYSKTQRSVLNLENFLLKKRPLCDLYVHNFKYRLP